ncbi:MAG: galactose oxidase early set domain-containing protein [Pseudomonadota bacterium]
MKKNLMGALAPGLLVTGLLAACGGTGSPEPMQAEQPAAPSPIAGLPGIPGLSPGAPSPAPAPGAKTCADNANNYNQLVGDAAAMASKGGFTAPFCEEKFLSEYDYGTAPVFNNPVRADTEYPNCVRQEGGFFECKPSAGSVALLPDNRVVYFNALEGTENVEFNIVKEFGDVAVSDQTRILSMGGNGRASWARPINNDTGSINPNIGTGLSPDDEFRNDGALFCSHLVQLYDGRIMAAGGTDYYTELGIVELEGLRNARLFDYRNDTWSQTGSMKYGRWYPTMVTLGDGNVMIVGGVTKLIKPVYPDRPLASGRNVLETERYDLGCGTWIDHGIDGQKSLPLYARMHLLPNGHVYYGAAGQAFNPFGQSVDQPLWNIASAYDPVANQWTDIGIPGLPAAFNSGFAALPMDLTLPNLPVAGPVVEQPALGPALPPLPVPDMPAAAEAFFTVLNSIPFPPVSTLADGLTPVLDAAPELTAGFRGSTFNMMMPLVPDAEGNYTRAEFLTAGGTLGLVAATNPGSGVPIAQSRIDTIDIGSDNALALSSRATGSLNRARWYGTAVLLPTGSVMLFSGADFDEVILPGTGVPIVETEMFDPATETWTVMATQGQARTYHNTEVLLPDGRVLVGGHAPISTGYAYDLQLPGKSPQRGRDPSFEIYSPPYVFQPRPVISQAPSELSHGESFAISVPNAAAIESVVLMRRSAMTHIVDGDQRSVVLPITSRDGGRLTLKMPSVNHVAPPGYYMLFVNQRTASGLVPSVSSSVLVKGAELACTSTPGT